MKKALAKLGKELKRVVKDRANNGFCATQIRLSRDGVEIHGFTTSTALKILIKTAVDMDMDYPYLSSTIGGENCLRWC